MSVAKKVFILSVLSSGLLFGTLLFLGRGINLFDKQFFYLSSSINPAIEMLGPVGRAHYKHIMLIDFGFVLSYTIFFISAYVLFFKKHAKTLLIVPVFLALFDILENISILVLLKNYPESSNLFKTLLVISTPAKWFFAMASGLVLFNGYLVKKYFGSSIH